MLTTSLQTQVAWLFILAIPIACIAWTVTHEALFAEPRAYCNRRQAAAKSLFTKKFFYLFTCEYCFSFYVTMLVLVVSGYQLLFADWRGYAVAGFSLVWISNIYMSIFLFIRTDIKKEGLDAKVKENELKS